MDESAVDMTIVAALSCVVGALFGVWLCMGPGLCRETAERMYPGRSHACRLGATAEVVDDVVVCRCPGAGNGVKGGAR